MSDIERMRIIDNNGVERNYGKRMAEMMLKNGSATRAGNSSSNNSTSRSSSRPSTTSSSSFGRPSSTSRSSGTSNSTSNNRSLVEDAYNNVLGLSGNFSNADKRIGFWEDQLNKGAVSKDNFLNEFKYQAGNVSDGLTDGEYARNQRVLTQRSQQQNNSAAANAMQQQQEMMQRQMEQQQKQQQQYVDQMRELANENGQAAQADVPQSQTTQGLLGDIMSQDSPLMRRAQTQGMQAANSRGLLNSSMASEAAQGAMIHSAAPIAQQDANTYASLAQSNANAQNARQQQVMDMLSGSLSAQFEADQQMNRLFATSTANAWGVMANNMTDLVGQYSNQLERIQMNPDISSEEKSGMIEDVLAMRDSDLGFQEQLYNELPQYLANTGVFPNR